MIALVAVAPVLVVVAWAATAGIPSPLRADEQAPALPHRVEAGEQAQTQPVTVGVVRGTALPLEVPRTGTMTSLTLDVSTQVEPGEVLMTLNDRPLVAFAADAPLLRAVSKGSSGPDADRAISFLIAAKLLHGPRPDHVTTKVAAAIGDPLKLPPRRPLQ